MSNSDSIWNRVDNEVARIDNQVAQNQKIIETKLEELQGHLMVLDHRLNELQRFSDESQSRLAELEKPKPAPKKRTAKKNA